MTEPVRVLLLEDSEADADLIVAELASLHQRPQVERVHLPDAFATALGEFEPDVVLSDHALGDSETCAAIEVVRATRPIAAFIVVAEAVDERVAVACLRAGAEDIILKSNLSRLGDSIKAALVVRRPLAKLSPRQLQVMRLVAEGNTTPRIASRLHLSIKTVETHRGELMRRLGIHDVVGLVRYAVRIGLVASES